MNIWTLREIYPKVVIKGKEYTSFDEAWANATPGTCSECEEEKPVIICEHPYLEHVEWYEYDGYPYWCQSCYERQYLAAMSVFSSFR